MDTILSAVKDTLVDKALGRDGKDKDREAEQERCGRQDHDVSYPPNRSPAYSRDSEQYDGGGGNGYGGHGGRTLDPRPAGHGSDSLGDTRGYGRDEARHHGGSYDADHERGYGGHGGRAQEQGRSGYGQDSERDVRGYPRPEGEHGSGHGGHDQAYVRGTYEPSVGREYRPAPGSHTAAEYYSGASEEYRGAAEVAERESAESGSLFSSALKMLSRGGGRAQNDDVDEDQIVDSHKRVYGGGGSGQLGSQSLGQAAAMQALKRFTGGSGGGGGAAAAAGGQNAFIGLAMAEAVKLFDAQKAQGNVVSTMVVFLLWTKASN